MLLRRALRLAAAALLLLPALAAAIEFTPEPGCPPSATADLLDAFLTNADGTRPLTRDQAAALACHLTPLLARAAAGNASAQDALDGYYLAWRDAFRPQSWGGKPRSAPAQWAANLRAVVAINSDVASPFWAGLNAYSAMSADDFAASVLTTPPEADAVTTAAAARSRSGTSSPASSPKPKSNNAPSPSPAPATSPAPNAPKGKSKGHDRKLAAWIPVARFPPSVDWLAAGKVLPQPGFQAACGASWAFAAAAAIESQLMIGSKTNATTALSSQHIMDCTANSFGYPLSTCDMGSADDALLFVAQTGVGADAAYRYRSLNPGSDQDAPGFKKQCDRGFLTGQAAKYGLVRITGRPASKQVSPASNKAALLQALAAQPAVTALAVDASFQHYAGGIWTSTACNATSAPTHTLLLVGYSTLPAGQEHFLAKNSLGAAWGEAGFARLAMAGDGPGLCGMYRAAYQPGAVTAIGGSKAGAGSAPAPAPAS